MQELNKRLAARDAEVAELGKDRDYWQNLHAVTLQLSEVRCSSVMKLSYSNRKLKKEVAKLERAVVKHKANYEAANNESCEILKSEEKFRIKVTELVDALEAISKNIHPTNAWARIIANNILDKFKGGGE